MTSSWVKGIIAMETHLPLFLYDLMQHAFKNMKAILLQTCIPAPQTDTSVEGKLPHQCRKAGHPTMTKKRFFDSSCYL